MSSLSPTALRKQSETYHEDDLASLAGQGATGGVGAWNADTPVSQLGQFDFSEVRNLRQVKMGALRVRTGPKLYAIHGTIQE